MQYRRVLTIQDISCVGQCSMTVAMPILSACGQETCILPSAVLSTHTGGFGKPEIVNLTDSMSRIWQHWQRQEISFDAILIGYLGSVEAVSCAKEIIASMLAPDGRVIVDPAMADHGKLYSGLSESYARAMGELCTMADVILPNLTEAAMMTGTAYREDLTEAEILELLHKLQCNNVLLTGVSLESGKTGFALRMDDKTCFYQHDKTSGSYHGTGDIFASCFTGAWMSGKSMKRAAQIAADFTFKCIQNTRENPAHWYGVKFETALPELWEMLKTE